MTQFNVTYMYVYIYMKPHKTLLLLFCTVNFHSCSPTYFTFLLYNISWNCVFLSGFSLSSSQGTNFNVTFNGGVMVNSFFIETLHFSVLKYVLSDVEV